MTKSAFKALKTTSFMQSFEQLAQSESICYNVAQLIRSGDLTREEAIELSLLHVHQKMMQLDQLMQTMLWLRLPDPLVDRLLRAFAPLVDEASLLDNPPEKGGDHVGLILTQEEYARARQGVALLRGLRDRDPFSFPQREGGGSVPGRGPGEAPPGDNPSGQLDRAGG